MRQQAGLDEIRSITGTDYGPPTTLLTPSLLTLSPQQQGLSLKPTPTATRQDNSMFGSGPSLSVEEDRRRIEKELQAFKGPCLLDCIVVELANVDVFSAHKERGRGGGRIVREPGVVLKEKGAAKLFIERNLFQDFCRDGVFVCEFVFPD